MRVNGIQFHNWVAGAGFGIVDYFISSLPLFIDVKKEFALKKMKLLLYRDVGTHFITNDKTNSTVFSSTIIIQKEIYAWMAEQGLKLKPVEKVMPGSAWRTP